MGSQSPLQNGWIPQVATDGPRGVGKIFLYCGMKTMYVDFNFMGMKAGTRENRQRQARPCLMSDPASLPFREMWLAVDGAPGRYQLSVRAQHSALCVPQDPPPELFSEINLSDW